MALPSENKKEKLIDKPVLEGLTVPLAIILVGALIIFGVTKMLSSGRDHRDLIKEMHTTTFGNRWVAAFELSKLLASNSIPAEEREWVAENLVQIYYETEDPRTRNFIILALGTLPTAKSIEAINKAVQDPDEKVKFNAVVALGNLPVGSFIDANNLLPLLNSEDKGLAQVVIFTLATHQVKEAEAKIIPLVNSSDRLVRYSAATALIHYRREEIQKTIQEIMMLNESNTSTGLNGAQVEALKMNVLSALQKNRWGKFEKLLEQVAQEDTNVKISTKAREVLNLLKN
ncbi:MAG: HEAT repeat domain-containing protein [Bacteriovoracaceae bacterium]|nr:HEAT repeat domain-containing protein [Bacteriovoracaceae bacterium]